MQLNNRKTNSTFKKWAEDSNRNYYKDDRQIDNKHEKMLGIIHYLLLFSRSIVSDSVLYCPSPSPGACSNSCPLSWWCHPAVSSSVVPFSSCLQSFPASGSFPMSQLFTSSGQQTYWSFNFSISPSNEYSGLVSFRIDWFDLLLSKGLSRIFSSTRVWND